MAPVSCAPFSNWRENPGFASSPWEDSRSPSSPPGDDVAAAESSPEKTVRNAFPSRSSARAAE